MWIEIFKLGKQTDSKERTREYTAVDLDAIVDGYDPEHHEAPVL